MCVRCKGFNHSFNACIIQPISEYPDLDVESNFDYRNFISQHNNSYIEIDRGMGCSLFIRNKHNILMTLFMHNDMWGQYGSNCDDSPKLIKFIENLNEITDLYISVYENSIRSSPILIDINSNSNTNTTTTTTTTTTNTTSTKIVKCPLCRTENEEKEIITIKGSSEKCSICYENEIQKCFVKCGHACICNTCFDNL